jgi:hypothetical protein
MKEKKQNSNARNSSGRRKKLRQYFVEKKITRGYPMKDSSQKKIYPRKNQKNDRKKFIKIPRGQYYLYFPPFPIRNPTRGRREQQWIKNKAIPLTLVGVDSPYLKKLPNHQKSPKSPKITKNNKNHQKSTKFTKNHLTSRKFVENPERAKKSRGKIKFTIRKKFFA